MITIKNKIDLMPINYKNYIVFELQPDNNYMKYKFTP